MKIDMGELCTHCGEDTLELASSGMRISSGADAKLVLNDAEKDIEVTGWQCLKCREIECDRCGSMTHEYEILDKPTPEVVCQHCKAIEVLHRVISEYQEELYSLSMREKDDIDPDRIEEWNQQRETMNEIQSAIELLAGERK